MKKLLVALLLSLLPGVALAQNNPSTAQWQGTRTSGHGAMFLNSGQGVTIQDSGAPGRQAFYLPSYAGYHCDGTTADDTAFANALSDATTAGGGLITLPPGKTCTLGTTLSITAPGVWLGCQQGAAPVNATAPGCAIKWIGAAAGRMISFASTTTPAISGQGIENIQVDCNAGLAADGIYVQSSFRWVLRNVGIRNCAGGSDLYFDVLASSNLNMQDALINGLYISNAAYATNYGIRMECGANGAAAYCTAYNTFINFDLVMPAAATPILFDGAANNFFRGGRIFGGATSGPSADLSIFSSGSAYQAAAGNVIEDTYFQYPPIARGTTSFPSCVSYTSPPNISNACTFWNVISRMGVINGGSASPTIETGAQLNFSTNRGDAYGLQAIGKTPRFALTVMSNYGSAIACENDQITNAALLGGIFYCDPGGHAMEFFDIGPNQDQWYWRSVGAAGVRNWQFFHPLGTGHVVFADQIETLSYVNAAQPYQKGGVNLVFGGSTGSMGGSSLANGACASATLPITGVTTAMTAMASAAGTDAGDGFVVRAFVSSAGNVAVKVCNATGAAATPTATTYNVRVLQ